MATRTSGKHVYIDDIYLYISLRIYVKFHIILVLNERKEYFLLNLPASGALTVFSGMRKPNVSETHVVSFNLKHRKKELEKR